MTLDEYLHLQWSEAVDVHPTGCVPTPAQVADKTEDFFKRFDTNGDGTATREEGVAYRTAKYASDKEESQDHHHIATKMAKKKASIAEKDVDGNGKVSVDEQDLH